MTSHDTDDMEKVCERVIIINKGKLIFNDSISALRDSYLNKKYIEVTTENGEKIKTVVNTKEKPAKQAIDELVKKYHVTDMTVENPPMEEIIKEIYNRG